MRRTSWRDDLVTVAAGAWLIGGLFLDGWAHNSRKPETFFSPWHAVFYSGFTVTALWMAWLLKRGGGLAAGSRAVPEGYGLGVVGVGIFGVGGLFDMAWHQVFGVEVSIEALLSPSHLVLFAGALLVVTSPYRAVSSRLPDPKPRFADALPAVLSLTLLTALIAFFFFYLSPFVHPAGDTHTEGVVGELFTSDAIASILMTTVILMGPTMVLIRRWMPPPGAITLLFSPVALLMTALDGFTLVALAMAAVIAGVAGDILAARLRPSVARQGAYLAFAAAVPPVLWLAYFAITEIRSEVFWSVELWSGVSGMSAFAGLGVALLTLPARTATTAATATAAAAETNGSMPATPAPKPTAPTG